MGELGVEDRDLGALRATRVKRLSASIHFRVAAVLGGAALGTIAGVQLHDTSPSEIYPYCVTPLAFVRMPKPGRTLAAIVLATVVGVAVGYLLIGPAYSGSDDFAAGTYYGVWSPREALETPL